MNECCTTFPDAKKPGTFTLSSSCLHYDNPEPFRENCSFWKSQKPVVVTKEDGMLQMKPNSSYDTNDFLPDPLLPTIKRNKENKVAMLLERNKQMERKLTQ